MWCLSFANLFIFHQIYYYYREDPIMRMCHVEIAKLAVNDTSTNWFRFNPRLQDFKITPQILSFIIHFIIPVKPCSKGLN